MWLSFFNLRSGLRFLATFPLSACLFSLSSYRSLRAWFFFLLNPFTLFESYWLSCIYKFIFPYPRRACWCICDSIYWIYWWHRRNQHGMIVFLIYCTLLGRVVSWCTIRSYSSSNSILIGLKTIALNQLWLTLGAKEIRISCNHFTLSCTTRLNCKKAFSIDHKVRRQK